MNGSWGAVLPPGQRRELDELTAKLDLDHGDRGAKLSGFWTMLVLSAVIALAGVLADSTATVIGAMIIAPLSVPIMGVALGIVRADGGMVLRSLGWVAAGVTAVVGLGVLAAIPLPDTVGTVANPQIAARTSPGILDMVAAVATGLAGAVGLSRKDVSDVLPVDRVTHVGLDELTKVLLEEGIVHAEGAAGVEDLLVEEEAVGAVQVADRAGGLGEQVEGGGRVRGTRRQRRGVVHVGLLSSDMFSVAGLRRIRTLIRNTQTGKISVTHRLTLISTSSVNASTQVTATVQRFMRPVRSQIVPSEIMKTPAMRSA